MAHLITSSLLDSFAFMQTCPESWKERATNDFVGTVQRTKPYSPSKEAQRGIDFEKIVCDASMQAVDKERDYVKGAFQNILTATYGVCDGNAFDGYAVDLALDCSLPIVDAIRGGEFQRKVVGTLACGGDEWRFFGYADAYFPDKILDIKTTTNFKASKYSSRAQHLVYAYCTGISRFEYLVAEYKGEALPVAYHNVALDIDASDAEQRLAGRIKTMRSWLVQHDLWYDYVHKFSREG